jgi:hypothetical protein
MSFTACQLHFTNRGGKTVYASGALMKQLKLSSKNSVKLVLGTKEIRTPLRRVRKPGKHLYMPAGLRSAIRIPRNGSSYIRNDAGDVKLGPLIGIMTTSTNRSIDRPFGGRTELIKSFLRAGSKRAFYFAFNPRDINWQDETVAAYFPNPKGGWNRRIVPLPDVIYNRLPSRSAEKSAHMLSIKERFIRRGIPVFNWSFFDKWDVYELLQDDEDAKPHVPESYVNPSAEQIKQLLHKHQFIYLKPTAGSLGKGIYRLTYNKQRGYFARFRSNGRNALLRFTKFSGLMKLLKRSKGRLHNYVVQQGVKLVELDRCPIDFRFHLNKNGSNEWVVGGIGAKKAGKGSVTTHVRTGGQVMSPEVALSRIYGNERAETVLAEAKRTAIKLARAIERNYKYRIGELGFDLGIDKDGQIWMFEANAKPGRSIFKHPALKAEGKRTLALLFEHCLYLSRFRKTKGDD